MIVEAKPQILVRLAAVTGADLALVGWIVISALQDHKVLFAGRLDRDNKPIAFWSALAAVIIVGIGMVAVLGYVILVP